MSEKKITNENQGEQEKEPNFFQKIISKIKGFFKGIAADNPYFKQTMIRINNTYSLYGRVNTRVSDGDFKRGSYVSIIDNKGVIYGSAQEDYVFTAEDVVSLESTPGTERIKCGNEELLAGCYILTFKDGKVAHADIILNKLEIFKKQFGLV